MAQTSEEDLIERYANALNNYHEAETAFRDGPTFETYTRYQTAAKRFTVLKGALADVVAYSDAYHSDPVLFSPSTT